MSVSGVLFSVVAFIVALGVLITVHEFGHFWVARKLGVRVLRFSVGFGRPLWRHQKTPEDTEYVISALPLGGYVKMLDEREVEVPAELRDLAFNRKSVWVRFAVVAAGPIFNFLLAIVAYWLVFVIGTTGLKPVIGEIEPGSAGDHAGFQPNEQIVAVDDRSTGTWEDVRSALFDAALDEGRLQVEVQRTNGELVTRQLDLTDSKAVLEEGKVLRNIGLTPWRPHIEPVIGQTQEGGAAAAAGLQPGDRIIKADGRDIADWQAWVEYVQARPQTNIEVTVNRDGRTKQLLLRPERRSRQGKDVGFIGASPQVPEDAYEGMTVEVRHGPAGAIPKSLARTGEVTVLTLRLLGEMVVGGVSLDNISGPITIAQYAGYTASIGVASFVSFLALVSISLGVLNLLPIPILDGGHLMYYIVEMIKGSPVSEVAQALGQRIGIAILIMLMGLAFYNDFVRLLG